MRSRHKEYQNGRGGKWTCRIIWYQEHGGENIRLHLETLDGGVDMYPESTDQAQVIWDEFKADHPFVKESRKSR